MHKIDLSKYEVRTDMIVDLLDEETSKLSNETLEDGVKISWMELDEDNPFNKKPGNYLTILFDDVTDSDARNLVSNIFEREFKKMLKKIGYNKDYTYRYHSVIPSCKKGVEKWTRTPKKKSL